MNGKAQTRQRILVVAAGNRAWGAGYRFKHLNSFLAKHFTVETLFTDINGLSKEKEQRPREFPTLTPRWAQDVSALDQKTFDSMLQRTLAHAKPNIVIYSGTGVLPYIRRRLEIPTVIDAYDLRWVLTERTLLIDKPVSIKRSLQRRVEVAKAKLYESRKHSLATEVWVCSEIERQKVIKKMRRTRIRVVPNFFSQECISSQTELTSRKPIVLFVGTMGYFANRDGVAWFLKHVWPSVHQRIPHAEFWLVGPWPTWVEMSAEYSLPGVRVLGFVEDLNSVFAQVRVFVSPLRIASGTRIKILEAWSYQIPVLSTAIGIEGLDAIEGIHACISDDPDEFAKALVTLLENPNTGKAMGKAGHNLWREKFSGEKVSDTVVQYCKELLDSVE